MLDRFTQSFSELKNSISLKYIDASLRERSNEILELVRECMPEAEVCSRYISKIEEVHEDFMHSISVFIDSFPHYAAEYQQNFEAMQQELIAVNRTSEQEKREWQMMTQEMSDKMERIHREIFTKEEEIRWLHLKVEEREAFIEQLEKQSNDYLKKVEGDMYKQQKALEESCFIVSKLEEEVVSLRYQNEMLVQAKQTVNLPQVSAEVVNVAELQINRSISESSSSRSYVKCSMGSNSSHEGLSQFELIHHQDQREVLDSIDFNAQLPPKCETLKQMLNMSVQKQYKLQYNKCDSIQNKLCKENYKLFQLRDEGAKQNNEGWGVNNSLEFMGKDGKRQPIKEFNLNTNAKEDSRKDNPYYFYFLIASQNAKINSEHFQEICTISTLSQWEELNSSKTPLHEWESHLRTYLLQQAKIV